MSNQFWRLPRVMQETGLGRSAIYARMDEGSFPKSFNISPRCIAWLSDEIDAWKAAQLAKRHAKEAA